MPSFRESRCQRFGVELGHATRFWDRADVDELRDIVSFQHVHKFLQRMRGMADGEDREGGFLVRFWSAWSLWALRSDLISCQFVALRLVSA